MKITGRQLTRLQTLYSQWERHSLSCPGSSREARLAWASQLTARSVASFSALTIEEGKRLIDTLQDAVGHKHPAQKKRRPPTTRDRQKKGTEGRHDQIHAETTIAGPSEFELIQQALSRLGWTQARLEAFLRSPRSPIKPHTQIRTLYQANRVYWASRKLTPYANLRPQ
jgi:hypothetical protein